MLRRSAGVTAGFLTTVWLSGLAVLAHEALPHKTRYGGYVVSVKQYHFELVPKGADGFQLYVLDDLMRICSTLNVTGQALVKLNGKKPTIPLKPMRDHLHGWIDLSQAKHYVVIVTVRIKGKLYTGRIEVTARARTH